MRKIICALLACLTVVSAALCFTGCGCNDDKSKESNKNSGPGYVVPTTEPDLKDENFGFYIINSKELMLTKYYGKGGKVEIPATFQGYNVTIIGHSAFNGKNVEEVVMPDSITEVQDYAFSGNKNLKSVKLSKNVKVLGINTFFNCKALTSIELPATLKEIGSYAFCATGLTSVVIPESKTLTSLPQFCFFQCASLKEVTIPVTITKIPKDAFKECSADLTIKAYSGSYALNYAQKNGIKYEELKR